MASDTSPSAIGATAAPAATALGRLPTGTKLFLILIVGLLPLALIAVFATLQTTRLADAESRARLRIASSESAHAIAVELVGDMTALSTAADALGRDLSDAPSCARVQGVFAQKTSAGSRFAVIDRAGRTICGAPLAQVLTNDMAQDAAIVPGHGVILSRRTERAGLITRAFFPRSTLARLARPASRVTMFDSKLVLDDDALPLQSVAGLGPLTRVDTLDTELGVGQLKLVTSAQRPAMTSSAMVAMLLPLLMWASAAAIAWFVVDRLLIRPLRQLRTSVAAFTPGEVIDFVASGPLPAAEIRELGDTFRAISRTVAIHEAGLAEGLVRQTKLTREVHHRVKNNLQVISSLINFHARGSKSADATEAYASIQRRVDALAVVHRNHFAEMEDNRGLNVRTMIGELSANIRATAPEGSAGLGITLDVEGVCVSQDVAVAIAFLVTEMVELAMNCDPVAQIRVVVRTAEEPDRALLRVVSRALVESNEMRDLSSRRYARIMEGLSRQLRAKLYHDPLAGAYEISFAIVGRA